MKTVFGYTIGALLAVSSVFAADQAPSSNPATPTTPQRNGNFENPVVPQQTTPAAPPARTGSKQALSSGSFNGTVESINTENNSIQVRDQNGKISSLQVEGSKITRGDKNVKLRTLKSGDKITYLRGDTGSIQKIKIN